MSETPHRRIVRHLRAGEFAAAGALCETLLAADPEDPVALHYSGVVALHRGDAARAVQLIGASLQLSPAMPDAAANLAAAYLALDRLDDADAAYARALELDSTLAAALRGRERLRAELEQKTAAIALHQQGEHARAEEAYRALLARRPRYPEILNNLGVLTLQGGDARAAADWLQKAVAAKQEMADTWANLGAALKQLGRPEAAVKAYRRALELAPRLASAHFNLGHALVELQRLEEAVAAYEAALACEPDHAAARLALVHQRRHLCDWRAYDADHAELRALVASGATDVSPFHALVGLDDPALQARCAERMSCQVARGVVPLPPREPRAGPRIRVGYLSSDFRRHPVAWLVSELIERHDRARFEVFAYSHGVDDRSEERARLERAFDRFVELRGASAGQAAARIRADAVDILVDLNGHTLGARTGILARRPAPVQAAWLGYPGAMGATYVDYVLADAFVAPPEHQRWYAERLVHLPDCFQPSDTRKPSAAHAGDRAGCGLPAQGFVFCCFNNAYKLTPPFFDAWMRLLRAVPDSVLWLVEMSPPVRANLEREAHARGVAPARLVFAQRAPLPEYMARYRLADLFLDTLPYNAGTTANDALWSGLPVLTVAGRSFAARMAGSLLRAAGLPELVTASLAEYESLALQLAREPARLAALRERLVTGRATAPLFDCARFARGIEAAYAAMWARCLGGEPPAAIRV